MKKVFVVFKCPRCGRLTKFDKEVEDSEPDFKPVPVTSDMIKECACEK